MTVWRKGAGVLAPIAMGLAFALSGPAAAQPAPAAQQAPVYELTKLAGAVWRFRSNNHYGLVMVTRDGAVVIDPLNAGAARWLKEELARRFNGLKVVRVVYSHHDWDHASGAAEFGPVPVVAQAATIKELQPPADPAARERFIRQFAAVAPPTETFTGKVKRITLGGHAMELHAHPSRHAEDLSLIWFPAERIVMVVDVMSPGRLPYRTIDDYDPADLDSVLNHALAFKPRIVVGGHGDVGTPQSIADLRGYFADLRRGVADGIARGLSLEAIKREVTLDRYRNWGDYTTFREMNIEGMHRYLTKSANRP